AQAEWIGIRKTPALVEKGSIEERVEREGASTERWLGAELLQHKLLNRIIEQSPSSLNGGLARTSRTPGDSDSRSKGFVIGLRQGIRNAGISRDDQAHRRHRRTVGVNCVFAWIHRTHLSGAERLHMLAHIGNRRI